MEAILFVGHGSKDPEGNQELAQFAQRMAKRLKTDIIEICFLEFAEPDLPQGIERCVSHGDPSGKAPLSRGNVSIQTSG
jgi:sirohydrochlorin cobaltochelatase